MQLFKSQFRQPNGTVDGTIQRCLRTNDLDEVGDGRHLTSFEMVGNFSFGGPSYDTSIELWHVVLRQLRLPVTHITVHPSRDDHRQLWERRGYTVRPDPECVWTDGDIGGYSTEVYVGELEIGNLVNTLEVSTDVGFGLERVLQVVEGTDRVDQTSLFDQRFSPVERDHVRTLSWLWEQGIGPGPRGRGYVVRRLLRRVLHTLPADRPSVVFEPWLDQERQLRDTGFKTGRRLMRRHSHQPDSWWWETCGLLPEEVRLLRS